MSELKESIQKILDNTSTIIGCQFAIDDLIELKKGVTVFEEIEIVDAELKVFDKIVELQDNNNPVAKFMPQVYLLSR